jgi:hypothetical protein
MTIETVDDLDASSPLKPVVLVELMLDTPVRAFNGAGQIEWAEFVWTGIGDLGSISEIGGETDLDAAEVRLTLSGIPSDYRSYLLNTVARGSDLTIYEGYWDEAVGDFLLEPEAEYFGVLNESNITEAVSDEGAAEIAIELAFVSAAMWVRRYTASRRTDAHQQSLFAGDKFFSFVTDLRTSVPTPTGPVNAGKANTSPRAIRGHASQR